MVIACILANFQIVVVNRTLGGYRCQVDHVKGSEQFGPVTITLFDKYGVQTDSYCAYEGTCGFSESDVLKGGKLGRHDYLIIRNADMSPWYLFVAAGKNGKIVHDEWDSRGEVFTVGGRDIASVIERVDLKQMRKLGIRMDIPDGSERDYDSKKYMTVLHYFEDGKHGRQYTFE
jgi:hypothetical protein